MNELFGNLCNQGAFIKLSYCMKSGCILDEHKGKVIATLGSYTLSGDESFRSQIDRELLSPEKASVKRYKNLGSFLYHHVELRVQDQSSGLNEKQQSISSQRSA